MTDVCYKAHFFMRVYSMTETERKKNMSHVFMRFDTIFS